VLERNAVQFRNVASGTYFDYRRYFLEVSELFAPAQRFDLGATQMRFQYSVGVAQWLLAGLGALTIFVRRLRRLSVLFFAFGALALVYLMLPASRQVWAAFPPMAYFQFPTRFLGPAAVAFGVLAGAAISWADFLPWKWARLAAASVAVALGVAAALPLMAPPSWPEFGPVTAQRILDTELNGRGIGTTSANDFLPVGALIVPVPQPALLESYARGQVDKLNRPALPSGAQAELLHHGPQDDRYLITGDTEFVMRLFTFYFPGWTAYVDGVKTPIQLSEPEGWITLTVPPGQHVVSVRLENTWPRWLAWGISALALAALLAAGLWRLRLPIERPRHIPLPLRQAGILAAVLVAGLGVRSAAESGNWLRVHSTGQEVLVAQYEEYAPLEQNVALLGFDLPQTTARPGESVPMTLYWKALAPMTVNLRVFIHLIGPDGHLWGQSDKWNPADYPTARWPQDYYVRDEHDVQLQPDAPAGQYQVIAGLWNAETGARMHRLDDTGQPTGADGVLLSDSFTVRP
jgi:hypothetical protein